MEEIINVDWKQLTDALTREELNAAYGNADIVGLAYWSNLNNFNDLVVKLCENVIKPGTRMFFDFADIRKRDKQALMESLRILAELNEAYPMTLSLNEHEAGLLFSHMGRQFDWKNHETADRDIAYSKPH